MATREIRSVAIKFGFAPEAVCESESVRFAGCRPERYEKLADSETLVEVLSL